MGFQQVPVFKNYTDADGKQQSSLSFSFDFASEPFQQNDVLGTLHTSVKRLINPRDYTGSTQPPAFRCASFKLVFVRPAVVNVQQGELYLINRESNFVVSLQNPQWNNTATTQFSQVSGVIPVEIPLGGTLELQKITDNNPDGTQTPSGFLMLTLFTKQLPAYTQGGLLVELDESNQGQ